MVQQPPPFGGKPGASGTGRRSLLDVDESEMWAPDASQSAAEDFAARFEQATADLEDLSLEDLSEPDGGDARPEADAPPDAASLETPEERERRQAEAAASMAAKLDAAAVEGDLDDDPSGLGADAFAPPDGVESDDLQLDFAAAGMGRPSGGSALPVARPAAPAPAPSASMSGAAPTALVPSPGTSMVAAASPAPPRPEHDSLLGVDRLSAGLIGLAILIAAFRMPDFLTPLQRIAESLEDIFAD